jgi:hypothetical protein
VHIVLRDRHRIGGLFTDSAVNAWLLSFSARPVARPRRRRVDRPSHHAPRLPPRRPIAALAIGAATLAGCTAPGLILTAAGIATDTSMTWEMVKHVHAQLTEDDPTPCALLNSVQRALNGRCEFVPGSIRRPTSPRAACRRAAHRRDAGRAPVARPAELIEKGASYERCARSPLQDLAENRRLPELPGRVSRDPEGDGLPRRQRPALGPPRRLSHAQLQERARRRPRPGARRLARSRQAAARHPLRSARSRRSTPTSS